MHERLILSHLLNNESYIRKVLPYIKSEYFLNKNERDLFSVIESFFKLYNKLPTKRILELEIEKLNYNEDQLNNSKVIISGLNFGEESIDYLLQVTEKWCQDQALHNKFLLGIKILDGSEKKLTKDSLPDLMREALSVSFDNNIGHDYYADAEERYDYYTRKEEKVPFGIKLLDLVTNGGMSLKTLNAFLAGTNVGKTLVMCDISGNAIQAGYDTLYITAEMSAKEISKRIDSKLLDIEIGKLNTIDKDFFLNRFDYINKKNHGKLIVHEFPTGSANSIHIETLLNELKLKKNFIPRLLVIDYINLFNSSRYKDGNSYTIVKAVTEEFRGICVKYNMAGLTATQTNRSGHSNSDIELDNTAESFGLPMTLDALWALISTDELEDLGQIMVKQLKSRYNNKNWYKKFVIGIDKSKMRLYDIDDPEAQKLSNSGQPQQVKQFKDFDFS